MITMPIPRPQERRVSPIAICIFLFVALAAVWLFAVPTSTIQSSTRSVQARPKLLTGFNKVSIARIAPRKVDVGQSKDADGGEEETSPAEIESETAATDNAELGVENKESPGTLITQIKESSQEREASVNASDEEVALSWSICSHKAGADYIPCLDNTEALEQLRSTKHYEHRERHCPFQDESQACLVPLPQGYKRPIRWPRSLNQVWYRNVPHVGLVSYKADQKWVTRKGEVLAFPGGGTQYKKGAMHYINYVEKTLPEVAWGKRTRVILDVGCGVASFGGYMFQKDVLTMSFAPKDEHEAQVQFALERGIPAISAVMGTQQLPFPANVYDAVHCARCRVPWHVEGAKLLVELNRLLRPGGYFIWSATPVYQREPLDLEIWKETTLWAAKMCWKQVARTKDPQTGIGVAIFQKPADNTCYEQRQEEVPPLCREGDEASPSWYVPLRSCIPRIVAVTWPEAWPRRLEAPPPRSMAGEDFQTDSAKWKHVVQNMYERGLGIEWDRVRNIMDMKAGFGGFAAALAGLPVWVMNVVPTSEPDTLPSIFDRGLFGIYHDWCESFSTYPRSYDLLHVDNLFVSIQQSCNVTHLFAEMDRMLRPEGWVIFRDKPAVLKGVEPLVKSLHWEVKYLTAEQDQQAEEQVAIVQKTYWRPS